MGKKGKKRFWASIENWLGLIGALTGIIAMVLSLMTYCNTKQDKKIVDNLQRANSLFENAGYDTIEYRKAYDIYKEIKKKRPNDMTGYYKFLNEAINRRIEFRIECDEWIKWYLLYAQKLQNTTEVQNRLNKCQ
jgi:hypothetical protein